MLLHMVLNNFFVLQLSGMMIDRRPDSSFQLTWVGNFLTKVFISFLAEYSDLQFFMLSGAAFQHLTASLTQVFWVRHVLPIWQGLPLTSALVLTCSFLSTCLSTSSGYFSRFVDFHISSSFMLAFCWLTDNV